MSELEPRHICIRCHRNPVFNRPGAKLCAECFLKALDTLFLQCEVNEVDKETLSISELLDEIARASIRVVDEVCKKPADHDGTKMVLVPQVLFERLEAAAKALQETGEY